MHFVRFGKKNSPQLLHLTPVRCDSSPGNGSLKSFSLIDTRIPFILGVFLILSMFDLKTPPFFDALDPTSSPAYYTSHSLLITCDKSFGSSILPTLISLRWSRNCSRRPRKHGLIPSSPCSLVLAPLLPSIARQFHGSDPMQRPLPAHLSIGAHHSR